MRGKTDYYEWRGVAFVNAKTNLSHALNEFFLSFVVFLVLAVEYIENGLLQVNGQLQTVVILLFSRLQTVVILLFCRLRIVPVGTFHLLEVAERW
jgi:hypothetical protein